MCLYVSSWHSEESWCLHLQSSGSASTPCTPWPWRYGHRDPSQCQVSLNQMTQRCVPEALNSQCTCSFILLLVLEDFRIMEEVLFVIIVCLWCFFFTQETDQNTKNRRCVFLSVRSELYSRLPACSMGHDIWPIYLHCETQTFQDLIKVVQNVQSSLKF